MRHFKGKGWSGQRFGRHCQQAELIIVPGYSIHLDRSTTDTLMQQAPLAAGIYGHRDGTHFALATAFSIARSNIEVLAPQALRAVITMTCARGLLRYNSTAMETRE